MADRLNVVVTFKATTTDGQPYFNTDVQYHNLPYADFVAIEKLLAGLMVELSKYGDAKIVGKK